MWYFIDTGENTAAWNMAFDEAVCETAEADKNFLLLRLYGWNPWSVSIGYGQKARQDICVSSVTERGYSVVRRPTGGRAVFHANEITYSVIANIACPGIGANLAETYATIGAALLRSLELAGFCGLTMARPGPHETVHGIGARPCFSSVSRCEIIWNNRKLAGSAQKRTRKTVLQHGSIPLGVEYKGIAGYIGEDEQKRCEYEKDLGSVSVSLDEIGPVPNRQKLAESFKSGFAGGWGADILSFECPPSFQKRVEHLSQTKYGSDTWTFRS